LRPQDIIRKKRDGGELSREEITYFVNGVTHGEVADYQVSALLMAVFLNGMTDAEQAAQLYQDNLREFFRDSISPASHPRRRFAGVASVREPTP